MSETRLDRIQREKVDIVPYDSAWPTMFREEKQHLLTCLPRGLLNRIEHFGSTSVPGLVAKPIIDILVEVTSLEQTRKKIAPVLVSLGYDYFWRSNFFDDTPPFYAWFIKRDARGRRTYHIHMMESHFEQWDRLFFRDFLIARPELAEEYQALKLQLSSTHAHDRLAYTDGKSDFILRVTETAKRYYTTHA